MLKTIWRKWAWKMFLTSTFLTNFTIFEASNRILAQEFLFLHGNWNVQLIWKPRCNYPNMQSMSINTYKFLFDQYLSDFIFKASSDDDSWWNFVSWTFISWNFLFLSVDFFFKQKNLFISTLQTIQMKMKYPIKSIENVDIKWKVAPTF